ncbi:MAG: FkbM family methyltransferase [Alphaproteobacteria bacterium]|nr:FkbM family methyltransferase [Alphaproteobacteria bacterium SS10]
MSFKATDQKPIFQADFLEVRQCRRGVFGYYLTDMRQAVSLGRYGELFDPQVSLLLELVEPDDLVIDVGAGLGAYTIPLARKLIRGGGIVQAFEPARLNHQTLVMNVGLNRLVNVFDHRLAVGAEAGVKNVPLMNPLKKQDFGTLPEDADQGEPVQVITLDQLGLQRCRLIKVDVSGGELAVLQGAVNLIRTLGPVLFISYPGNYEPIRELLEFLEAEDYEAWWHFADMFQASNFAQADTNHFPGQMPDTNILALPKAAKATFPNMERVIGLDDWRQAALKRSTE